MGGKPLSFLCRDCDTTDPDEFYPYLRSQCKKCQKAYQKDYRRRQATADGMTKDKKYFLNRHYRLSPETYEALQEIAADRCEACDEVVPLHVDHNHKTGWVRGLLCNGCNRAVGFLDDDPDKVEGLHAYLMRAAAFDIYRAANGIPDRELSSFQMEKDGRAPGTPTTFDFLPELVGLIRRLMDGDERRQLAAKRDIRAGREFVQ